MSGYIGRVAAALALASGFVVGGTASAQEASCPIAGQKPALVAQLYMGQSVKNRGPVTKREWGAFLSRTVTPRFPDGFTVHDAYGQWLNTDLRAVIHEKTKVIVIIATDSPTARTSIAEVADAYRKQFRQQSVAIVSNTGCVVF